MYLAAVELPRHGMNPLAHLRRRAPLIAGALPTLALVVLLTGCPGQPVPRDRNDATPPTLTLAAAGLPGASGFIDVAPGSTVEMTRGTEVVLIARAADDDGVSSVELWTNEAQTCDNGNGTATQTGPGLVAAPTDRTEGEVTPTDAPSSLSATGNLPSDVPANCVREFEVWIIGANAADAAVTSQFPTATFVLRGGQ